MQRPELDRAMARIRSGESGGIIVAKIDRFARTLIGGLKTLEEIQELDGVVIVADGEFDTSTATGELVLNMMLSLAQFELRRISDNWQTAKRHAVDRGIHISRHVPPGYVRGEDRRLVPDKKHGATITKAFEMAAAGDSYSRIAEFLNERKMPIGGRKGVWQPNRIKRVLANRVYLGEARSGPGVVSPGAHVPLADSVTFALAQRDRLGPTVTASAGALLAGICRCASCSFSMRSQAPRGKNVGSYRCATAGVYGRCEAPSSVSRDRLEAYVLEQFLTRHGSLSVEAVESTEDAELVEAAAKAEQSYRAALTDMDLRKQIGDADHGLLVSRLNAEWQRALDAAAEVRGSSSPALESADLVKIVDELKSQGDIAGLRELLASSIDVVFVRPAASRSRTLPIEDRVRIVWRDEELDGLVLPKRGERFEPRPFSW